MILPLSNRHVVVTGGAGALGSEIVVALASEGATCHVLDRQPTPPPSLEVVPADRVRYVPGVDLTDEQAVATFYAGLPSVWASVHVAGGFAMRPVTDTSLADLRGQLELNAVTAFLCCREAVRRMRGRGGRIVNVAARPALVPTAGMLAYAMSKAAVATLTTALAEEVKGEGILVNAIVPSIIDTPANRAAMPGADHTSWPRPAEIAATVRFLVSPENALTAGALVPVYGQV